MADDFSRAVQHPHQSDTPCISVLGATDDPPSSELEKLRATVSRNQKLLKEYDNVTELSKMKNELRKMR